MSKFLDLIDLVFSEDGVLQQCGGRYDPQQANYARQVALSLEGKGFNALEAETGVGKSIGYLAPCSIFLALNPKSDRIIVSTFTRMLQKQIMNTDLVLVEKVVAALGLPPIKAALRMGRQAFFSMERTITHVNDLVLKYPEHKDLYQEFIDFAYDSCKTGSGMWMDWFEQGFLELPPHVSSRDICLLSFQKVDNDAYMVHKELAANSRLMITNHATMVMVYRDTARAVIFDEAHELPKIYQALYTTKTQLSSILNLLKKSFAYSKPKNALKMISQIEAVIDKVSAVDNKSEFVVQPHILASFNDDFKIIDNLCKKQHSAIVGIAKSGGDHVDGKFAECIDELGQIERTFKNWNSESDFNLKAIGFSKKIRKPSIVALNKNAGYWFSSNIQQITPCVILTSATISDPSPQVLFKNISYLLGIKDFEITTSISPTHYGDLDFVLCDKAVDKPANVDAENNISFNDGWVKNTLSMISEAYEDREATLVLTCSFDETELLAEKLRALGFDVLEHKRNTPITQYIMPFKQGGKILLSPGAWEGVSIVGPEGEQIFKKLIITRIPFTPINALLEELGFSEWFGQTYKVIGRLKQGIGRVIRNPKHKAVIYICDPRMPSAYDNFKDFTLLKYAIPKRFKAKYANAKIFSGESGSSKNAKPKLTFF